MKLVAMRITFFVSGVSISAFFEMKVTYCLDTLQEAKLKKTSIVTKNR